MPTWNEKQWDKDTGGDSAEQVDKRMVVLTIAGLAIVISEMLEIFEQIEYESGKEVDFDRFIYNPFSQTPRGWLKAIHYHLLDIQAEYQKEAEDGLD